MMNNRMKGILITLLLIVCLSPDTLFFRLLPMSAWNILFWRGLLVAFGVFIFLKVIKVPILEAILKGGLSALLVIFFDALSNVLFYSALSHTSVANTLVIISTVPIFAAVLGWVFLGDVVKKQTWLAISVVIGSVLILSAGSSSAGTGTLLGDGFAMGAALSLAISLVAIRKCAHLDMTSCVGFANLLTAIVVTPALKAPLLLSSHHTISLLLLMGLFSTMAMIFFVIAPRYISAAETSMFLPLETVLGSFLVWFFVGEPLAASTLVGGSIILTTVFLYSLNELHESLEKRGNVLCE